MTRRFTLILACLSITLLGHATDKSVTLEHPGTLSDILGDELMGIESISIAGTLNDDDILTLKEATKSGKLAEIDLSKAELANNALPNYAFYEATRLRNIILPETLTTIGTAAFGFDSDLEGIVIPESVTFLGEYAFEFCPSLRSAKLPDKLEEIPTASFLQCHNLRNITLPTNLKSIGAYALQGDNIETLTLPNSLEYIGEGALQYNKFTEIVVPDGCQIDALGIFASNFELESISLPTGIDCIPAETFQECIKLKNVNIPGSVTSIGRKAFLNCRQLTGIQFSKCLRRIEDGAFSDCSSLKTLALPGEVEYLGERAFENLTGLEAIYSESATPPTCYINPDVNHTAMSNTFDGCNADIPVYVPYGSVEAYANTPGWDRFTNFIETDKFPESGIETTIRDTAPAGDGLYYDLQGRRVDTPIPGHLYIHNSKKSIYSE